MRVHVVEGAAVAELEPHAFDLHLQPRARRPQAGVGLRRGVAQPLDDEAHEALPFRQLHALQQVVVAGEEGPGRGAAGVRLRHAQGAEDAHEQGVQRLGAAVPVHRQRCRPERVEAGRQGHAAQAAQAAQATTAAGQRSVWPVSRAKRSRSSGVSMSTL